MPKVGKKKFPYTAGGEKAAEKFAKQTGEKLTYAPPKKKAAKRK